jgi:hypothetical protein
MARGIDVRRTELLPRGERKVQQGREWTADKKENSDAHAERSPKAKQISHYYVLLSSAQSGFS